MSCPSSGYLPDPGIKPGSPALQAHCLPSEPPGKLEKRDFPDPEMNLGHGGESAEAWPLDLNPVLLGEAANSGFLFSVWLTCPAP